MLVYAICSLCYMYAMLYVCYIAYSTYYHAKYLAYTVVWCTYNIHHSILLYQCWPCYPALSVP